MGWARLRRFLGGRSPRPAAAAAEASFLDRWAEPVLWVEAGSGRVFLNAAARARLGDPPPASRQDLEARLQPLGVLERWLRGSSEPALVNGQRVHARVLPLSLDGHPGHFIVLQIAPEAPIPSPSIP
jgi:hypothetical protein